MKRSKPSWQRDIALERVNRLFELAGESHRAGSGMADRYVEIARKIAMHYKVGMPKNLRTRFCRKCGAFMVPGSTSTVRTRSSNKAVIIKCSRCGGVMRFPYGKRRVTHA